MPTPEAVLGTVSLITWSLIVIISLKYAVLMLRADNRGEGGDSTAGSPYEYGVLGRGSGVALCLSSA
jgi:hypothetical protein